MRKADSGDGPFGGLARTVSRLQARSRLAADLQVGGLIFWDG